jgi:hypothetical protein
MFDDDVVDIVSGMIYDFIKQNPGIDTSKKNFVESNFSVKELFRTFATEVITQTTEYFSSGDVDDYSDEDDDDLYGDEW